MITYSIIVPTYREGGNLDALTRRVFASLDNNGFKRGSVEMIIVDDNSQDGSVEVVEKLIKSNYIVQILVRAKERGLSSAVIHGFKYAEGKYFLVMDADLQHPPECVPSLLRAFDEKNCEFVLGTRYAHGTAIDKDWPFHRRIISWGARMLAQPLTPLSDPMSGFFGLRRDVFLNGKKDVSGIGYKIALELYVKCHVKSFQEVGFSFAARTVGESKLTGKVIIHYLQHLNSLYYYRFAQSSSIASKDDDEKSDLNNNNIEKNALISSLCPAELPQYPSRSKKLGSDHRKIKVPQVNVNENMEKFAQTDMLLAELRRGKTLGGFSVSVQPTATENNNMIIGLNPQTNKRRHRAFSSLTLLEASNFPSSSLIAQHRFFEEASKSYNNAFCCQQNEKLQTNTNVDILPMYVTPLTSSTGITNFTESRTSSSLSCHLASPSSLAYSSKNNNHHHHIDNNNNIKINEKALGGYNNLDNYHENNNNNIINGNDKNIIAPFFIDPHPATLPHLPQQPEAIIRHPTLYERRARPPVAGLPSLNLPQRSLGESQDDASRSSSPTKQDVQASLRRLLMSFPVMLDKNNDSQKQQTRQQDLSRMEDHTVANNYNHNNSDYNKKDVNEKIKEKGKKLGNYHNRDNKHINNNISSRSKCFPLFHSIPAVALADVGGGNYAEKKKGANNRFCDKNEKVPCIDLGEIKMKRKIVAARAATTLDFNESGGPQMKKNTSFFSSRDNKSGKRGMPDLFASPLSTCIGDALLPTSPSPYGERNHVITLATDPQKSQTTKIKESIISYSSILHAMTIEDPTCLIQKKQGGEYQTTRNRNWDHNQDILLASLSPPPHVDEYFFKLNSYIADVIGRSYKLLHVRTPTCPKSFLTQLTQKWHNGTTGGQHQPTLPNNFPLISTMTAGGTPKSSKTSSIQMHGYLNIQPGCQIGYYYHPYFLTDSAQSLEGGGGGRGDENAMDEGSETITNSSMAEAAAINHLNKNHHCLQTMTRGERWEGSGGERYQDSSSSWFTAHGDEEILVDSGLEENFFNLNSNFVDTSKRMSKRYVLIYELGWGQFSSVWLAYDKTANIPVKKKYIYRYNSISSRCNDHEGENKDISTSNLKMHPNNNNNKHENIDKNEQIPHGHHITNNNEDDNDYIFPTKNPFVAIKISKCSPSIIEDSKYEIKLLQYIQLMSSSGNIDITNSTSTTRIFTKVRNDHFPDHRPHSSKSSCSQDDLSLGGAANDSSQQQHSHQSDGNNDNSMKLNTDSELDFCTVEKLLSSSPCLPILNAFFLTARDLEENFEVNDFHKDDAKNNKNITFPRPLTFSSSTSQYTSYWSKKVHLCLVLSLCGSNLLCVIDYIRERNAYAKKQSEALNQTHLFKLLTSQKRQEDEFCHRAQRYREEVRKEQVKKKDEIKGSSWEDSTLMNVMVREGIPAQFKKQLMHEICLRYVVDDRAFQRFYSSVNYHTDISVLLSTFPPFHHSVVRNPYKRRSPEEVSLIKELIKCVLKGLAQLDKLKILHTDLKPENLLVAAPDVKIMKIIDVFLRKNLEATHYVRERLSKFFPHLNSDDNRRSKKWEEKESSLSHNETSLSLGDPYHLVAIADFGLSVLMETPARASMISVPLRGSHAEFLKESLLQKVEGKSDTSDKSNIPPSHYVKSSAILLNGVPRIKIKIGSRRGFRVNEAGSIVNSNGVLIQTREYRAPEVLLGYHILNSRTDIWSLACITYELVVGEFLIDPKKRAYINYQECKTEKNQQSSISAAATKTGTGEESGHKKGANDQAFMASCFTEREIDMDHLVMMMQIMGKVPDKITKAPAIAKAHAKFQEKETKREENSDIYIDGKFYNNGYESNKTKNNNINKQHGSRLQYRNAMEFCAVCGENNTCDLIPVPRYYNTFFTEDGNFKHPERFKYYYDKITGSRLATFGNAQGVRNLCASFSTSETKAAAVAASTSTPHGRYSSSFHHNQSHTYAVGDKHNDENMNFLKITTPPTKKDRNNANSTNHLSSLNTQNNPRNVSLDNIEEFYKSRSLFHEVIEYLGFSDGLLATDFLMRCLTFFPEERASAEELLVHPWLAW